MNTVRSITTPTLTSAQRAFAHWRAHRAGRSHTPRPLRLQAVALLEHHCAFHICRALGLHADALKRWARESSDATPSDNVTVSDVTDYFVALPDTNDTGRHPAISDSGNHTIIVERTDGLRLTITGTVSMVDLIATLADTGRTL